jgi:MFS family permease
MVLFSPLLVTFRYYLKDAIQVFEINGVQVATSAERAVSLLFLPLLVGAFISSICAGVVSDYYGGRRKFLVYIAGSLMSASALAFALTRSFEFDIVLAFVFGLGWGCFSAIDWAMATDVLPDADEVPRCLGCIGFTAVLIPICVAVCERHGRLVCLLCAASSVGRTNCRQFVGLF